MTNTITGKVIDVDTQRAAVTTGRTTKRPMSEQDGDGAPQAKHFKEDKRLGEGIHSKFLVMTPI